MNEWIHSQLRVVRWICDRWQKRQVRPLPDGVEGLFDIPYLPSGKEHHKLDVYRPKGAGEKLPVIVQLHGGGMVLCSRKVNGPICVELALRGYLVVCLDYPLVPEKDVPGILADVARGMDVIRERLCGWGGDPQRVYLMGDSAGAFLGVYSLASQKDEAVAQSLGLIPTDLQIRAAAFISGMFYTARADRTGAFLRKDFYGKDWKHHPFRPYMDPAVPQIAGALPPCMLVTARRDSLRSYTLELKKGLEKAGVIHSLVDLPWTLALGHDFPIVRPGHPRSQQVIDGICAFFARS